MGSYASYSHYSPRSPRGTVAISLSRATWTGPTSPATCGSCDHRRRPAQVVRALDDPQRSDADVSRSGHARAVRDRASPSRPRSRRRPMDSRTPASSARRSRSATDPPARERGSPSNGPAPGRGSTGRVSPSRRWSSSRRSSASSRRADWRHRSSSATSSSTRTWRRTSPTTASYLFRDATLHQSLLYPLLLAPAWFADSMGTTYALAKGITAAAMALAAVPVYLWGRRLVPPVARPARGCADAAACPRSSTRRSS